MLSKKNYTVGKARASACERCKKGTRRERRRGQQVMLSFITEQFSYASFIWYCCCLEYKLSYRRLQGSKNRSYKIDILKFMHFTHSTVPQALIHSLITLILDTFQTYLIVCYSRKIGSSRFLKNNNWGTEGIEMRKTKCRITVSQRR